ncbi:hypothetical protein RJ640_008710 [Escallonia rubra]|uniref:Subtilisin-like protease fibronectin type-III domain-containing protein n=1 Tax=Escallonia rubra TaxID=112253 RepID=A0AA88RUH9_9ASTE|nr:hypothetical protein RJ640_008710 [Escallonia rubra]
MEPLEELEHGPFSEEGKNLPLLLECWNPSREGRRQSANDSNSGVKIVQEFQRIVTYVGDGKSTYTAKLAPTDGLQVSVLQEKLVFSEKNDKQSYKLSIEGPRLIKDLVVYGTLSWGGNMR